MYQWTMLCSFVFPITEKIKSLLLLLIIITIIKQTTPPQTFLKLVAFSRQVGVMGKKQYLHKGLNCLKMHFYSKLWFFCPMTYLEPSLSRLQFPFPLYCCINVKQSKQLVDIFNDTGLKQEVTIIWIVPWKWYTTFWRGPPR